MVEGRLCPREDKPFTFLCVLRRLTRRFMARGYSMDLVAMDMVGYSAAGDQYSLSLLSIPSVFLEDGESSFYTYPPPAYSDRQKGNSRWKRTTPAPQCAPIPTRRYLPSLTLTFARRQGDYRSSCMALPAGPRRSPVVVPGTSDRCT